jgi:hypothetical protein
VRWFDENRQLCVLDHRQIVMHIRFCAAGMAGPHVLLEEIRRVNVREVAVWAPALRWIRLARQVPGIVRRRLGT